MVNAGCPFESDALSLPDHLSARYQLSTEELHIRMNANRFREEREDGGGGVENRQEGKRLYETRGDKRLSVLRFLTLHPVLTQPAFPKYWCLCTNVDVSAGPVLDNRRP